MNKKKLTIISVALVLVMAVSGVLAYLTDTSSATNVFTVGNVDISLDETKVNPDGTPVPDAPRVIENEYHLIPGQEYVKDPTITVAAKSEEAYIRSILTVTERTVVDEIIKDNNLTDYSALFSGWDETAWLYEGFEVDEENDTISFEFRYYTTVDGFNEAGEGEAAVLAPLFTKLVVPGTLNNAELEALKTCVMTVDGHAIQKAGFEEDKENNLTAEDVAWAAFDNQIKLDEEKANN